MIFSRNKKKLDPRRRFGSREFRTKIKDAQNYKRVFNPNPAGWWETILIFFGLRSKLIRYSLIAVLVLIFYFLVVSSQLRISNVTVTGNSSVSAETIAQTIAAAGNSRSFLVPKNHYLLMSKGRVNSLLTQNVPLVKEVVEANRKFPNRIEITIAERSPGFVLKSNEKLYLVDEEGMVIKETDNSEGFLLVENQVVESVAIRESFSPKTVAFILSMNRQWSTKINSSITGAKIPGKASGEVQFASSEGWNVFFNTDRPVLAQLASLSLVLSKQVPAQNRPNLAYIDLRLEKWAYICYKNTPCEAKPAQEEELTNEETENENEE